MLYQMNIDYLCILSIWEWDIRKRIYNENLFDLTKIINLYEFYMLSFFGENLCRSYQKMIGCVHPMQSFYAHEWEVYEYVKRNYSYVLFDEQYWKQDREKKIDFEENIRPIWILWLQGLAHAPEIVKACVRSIKKMVGKEERICLLDKKNLFDYIEFPDYIIQKWEKGIISNTHFSDLVRVRLLNVYGGIWIDATVYATGEKLPDYLKSDKLFMFSRWIGWKNCPEPRITASWLMSSSSGNRMLIILEAILNEYWKKEEKLIDYFLLHIFFTMIAFFLPNEWDKTEKILRDSAQLLAGELACEYNENRFEYLKKMAVFHKLSYKIPYEKYGEKSFYARILLT